MSSASKSIRLAVFLTRGNSLETWERLGSFERELALYRALQALGVHITLVSYGQQDARLFADRLPGMVICDNAARLRLFDYETRLPWLHQQALKACNVYKTNQIKGAHAALLAGLLWRKPVVVRAGYSWAESVQKENLPASRVRFVRAYQAVVLRLARQVVVTTAAMRQAVMPRLALTRKAAARRIAVIPNYVDTDLFSPGEQAPSDECEIVYIGRLSPQKNLHLLIEALQGVEAHLTMIGAGPLQAGLANQAQAAGVNVEWSGSLPHAQLPDRLRRAALFILPSQWEGHPKALLEAMACGVAVLGSDVTGIREAIRHGETGWLCAPEPNALRQAIEHLLSDAALRQKLGQAARQEIVENFSLANIAAQEKALLESLV